MHDIRFIRDNPDAFDAALTRRGLHAASLQKLIALDDQRRAKILALETAQARRNEASKEIGDAKKNKRRRESAKLAERSRGAERNDVLRWKREEKKAGEQA